MFRPNVVVMELLLPNASATDLIRALLAEQAIPHLKVLAYTGCSTPEVWNEAFEAGVQVVILKPDLEGQLWEQLNSLLSSA